MKLSNFITDGAKHSFRVKKDSYKPWTRLIGKWASNRGQTFSPPVDLFETENELCIVADLPGFQLGDLEISLIEGALLLAGTRQRERRTDRTFFCKERLCGSFQRTIHLPKRSLDSDAMEAELDKGVLKVTIPKKDSTELVPQILFSGNSNRSCIGHLVLAD
jgi:HSP20 family molecular chaperone IbpA